MTRTATLFLLIFLAAFSPAPSRQPDAELNLCDAVKKVTKAMKEKKFTLLKGESVAGDEFASKIDVAGWEDEKVYDDKATEFTFSAEYNAANTKEARAKFAELKTSFTRCLGVQPETMKHEDGETLQYEITDAILVELDLFAQDGEPDTWIDLKIIYSRN